MASTLARIAAAVFSGYALANLLPLALVGYLSTSRANAVLTALLASFVIYAAAIVWAFAARTPWRAWAGLLAPAALAGALLALQRIG